MARVTTETKRGWLRRRKSECPLGGGTTYQTLLAAIEASAFASIDGQRGGSVASVTAGDRSTSFSNADNTTNTPSAMADLGAEMLDLYETASTVLTAAGATVDDTTIYAEMMDRLQAVREFTNTFTGARL